MSITINEPLIVANTQNLFIKSISVDFSRQAIDIVTEIKNEDGELVTTYNDSLYYEEADTFWGNFNSKQYIYEYVVSKHGITETIESIPDTLIEASE